MAQLLQKYADLVCSGFLNVVIEIIYRNKNFCLSITKHIFLMIFTTLLSIF
jgi:hypothetical protein